MNIVFASTIYGGIGLNGKLPWDYPEDLAVFKALTHHGTVIMGSKTWDSLPKRPLPGRTNIVVTSKPEAHPGAFAYYSSLEAVQRKNLTTIGEDWVIGGARLITEAYPIARYVHHTLIPTGVQCDTFAERIPDYFLEIDEVVIKTASGMELLHTTYLNENFSSIPSYEDIQRDRIRKAIRQHQGQKESTAGN